jgi:glyceronephosphate O-acyltransferase
LQHNDIQLTTLNIIDWDHDHHRISFPSLFPDFTWTYTHSRKPGYTNRGIFGKILGWTGWEEDKNHQAKQIQRRVERTKSEMEALVLSSNSVKSATELYDQFCSSSNGPRGLRKAETMIKTMAADMNTQRARPAAYLLRKVWRSLYDSVNVDEVGLSRVRALLDGTAPGQSNATVIFVPSHRSYVDFIIMSYIFFAYNMPLPHIAAGDWMKKMGPMASYMKNSGAFVIRRSFQPQPDDSNCKNKKDAEENIYAAIFSSYLQQLMKDGQSVEFFLEGTRSRTGKSLTPKTGMLGAIVEPWLKEHPELLNTTSNSMSDLEDVVFVPVTIDYERVLELSSMASEVMGKSKVTETLPNLMKWIGGAALSRMGRSVSRVVGSIGSTSEERNVSLKGGGTDLFNLKKGEQTQMNEKGLFNSGYGPPLDIPNTGSMSLHFGNPISLSEYASRHVQEGETKDTTAATTTTTATTNTLVNDLAYHIMNRIHATSICHGTHLVASTILMYRSAGSIAFKELEEHTRWLASEVQARGMAVQMAPRHPTQWPTAIRRALGLLKDSIRELRPGVFATNDISFLPFGSNGSSSSSSSEDPRIHWIELSILRNKLIHLFYEESLWAVSLHSKIRQNKYSGGNSLTTTNDLMSDVLFMDNLFSTEFIRNRSSNMNTVNFLNILKRMTNNERKGSCTILNMNDNNISVASGSGETMFAFLCSMVWPFIDSYYVGALALFSLFPTNKIPRDDLALRMQWLAEALYHDRKIQHYESCSLDTLNNAMRTFERMGIIGRAPNDPSPISVDDNELDPKRKPYSPNMVKLMPGKYLFLLIFIHSYF